MHFGKDINREGYFFKEINFLGKKAKEDLGKHIAPELIPLKKPSYPPVHNSKKGQLKSGDKAKNI